MNRNAAIPLLPCTLSLTRMKTLPLIATILLLGTVVLQQTIINRQRDQIEGQAQMLWECRDERINLQTELQEYDTTEWIFVNAYFNPASTTQTMLPWSEGDTSEIEFVDVEDPEWTKFDHPYIYKFEEPWHFMPVKPPITKWLQPHYTTIEASIWIMSRGQGYRTKQPQTLSEYANAARYDAKHYWHDTIGWIVLPNGDSIADVPRERKYVSDDGLIWNEPTMDGKWRPYEYRHGERWYLDGGRGSDRNLIIPDPSNVVPIPSPPVFESDNE